jgi:hypothetical protein
VKVIRKLKDTTGRPIWTPGLRDGIALGQPDTLLGYPVVVNQDIAVDGGEREVDPLRRLHVLQDPRRDGDLDVPLHGLGVHEARPGRLPRVDALRRQPHGVTGTPNAIKYYQNSAT